MKILLCEAPYNYGSVNIATGRYFPLGIGYISSYLNSKGFKTELFLGKVDDFESKITKDKFDIIGISSMTPSFLNVVEMSKIAKKCSKATVVIGGQHASAFREKILKEIPTIDFLIYGEGENSFLELCTKINCQNKKDIKGLVWRDGDKIITNAPREFIADLDLLPYPKKELNDALTFSAHSHFKFGKTAPLITSRGCPYKCIFCSSRNTMGEKYRHHSVEYIISQIEYLYKEMDIRGIIFWDDTLTLLPERLEKMCQQIIKKGIKIQWYCLSRIDSVTEELLKLMKKAGLRMISFGIESGSETVQRKIKKGLSLDKANKIIRICEKEEIRTQASFILGFPFETVDTINETIEFAKKLSPAVAIFFSLIPFPGSEIFDSLPLEKKFVSLEEWSQAVATNTKVKSYNDKISSEELNNLINKAYLKFYLRPKQFLRIIKTLRSSSELMGYAKSALALFRRCYF
ncbi:MAG: radical SAM protein [Candidatus Omnitrophica bacterium]|nr:radical SAM protein [Candidatus Omnitrophota bacterium]